jgi:hypothetical protein
MSQERKPLFNDRDSMCKLENHSPLAEAEGRSKGSEVRKEIT